MGKKDEIFGYISGLDLDYGISRLKSTAFSMFEYFMLQTLRKSSYQVTFKTSAEVAATLTQPYIAKIAEQISPINIGETVRLMTIAKDYGERLNSLYTNLIDENSLDRLISGYSSHSFVIDLKEAQTLFRRASRAPEPLLSLIEALGSEMWFPPDDGVGEPVVAFLRRRRDVDPVVVSSGAEDDQSQGKPGEDTATEDDGSDDRSG